MTGPSYENQQSGDASVPENARANQLQEYQARTAAAVLSAPSFEALKEYLGLHVVGVTGFSGQWSQSKIDADPNLKTLVDQAREAMKDQLKELQATYGEKLVMSSGATMEGVPKLAYEICDELGIAAMGVACEKAFDYELGKMKYLIIEGADWGAESPTFLATADEFIMLGGGGQAKREAIAASAEGKKVTIFQGYGGSADQLSPNDVGTGNFVLPKQ